MSTRRGGEDAPFFLDRESDRCNLSAGTANCEGHRRSWLQTEFLARSQSGGRARHGRHSKRNKCTRARISMVCHLSSYYYFVFLRDDKSQCTARFDARECLYALSLCQSSRPRPVLGLPVTASLILFRHNLGTPGWYNCTPPKLRCICDVPIYLSLLSGLALY